MSLEWNENMMEMFGLGAICVILGWLLGLLSQPIVSRIERHYKREDFRKAIFSELKTLGTRLAATCYQIQSHLGMRDKEALRWVKSVYEKHKTDCPKGVIEAIDKVLQASNEQFSAVADFTKAPKNIYLGLKTFSVPLIDSIL